MLVQGSNNAMLTCAMRRFVILLLVPGGWGAGEA